MVLDTSVPSAVQPAVARATAFPAKRGRVYSMRMDVENKLPTNAERAPLSTTQNVVDTAACAGSTLFTGFPRNYSPVFRKLWENDWQSSPFATALKQNTLNAPNEDGLVWLDENVRQHDRLGVLLKFIKHKSFLFVGGAKNALNVFSTV